MDDVGSILVLEDDAVFAPDFGAAARQFIGALPADWEGIYFGGQHAFKPEPVAAGVVKCLSVYRTHAYAARGAYLCGLSYVWGNSQITLDHHQASICAAFNVYAPAKFIAGQGGGMSEISGLETTAEFWNEDWSGPKTFVHGQDIGDVIYGMPCMRDSGGGKLVLFHDERQPHSHALTAQRFGLLQPLLALQPYIESSEHKAAWQVIPGGFNAFRKFAHGGTNLISAHYRGMGMMSRHPAPWLTVDRREHKADVIFARSPRWTNPQRPAIWRKLYDAYGDKAVFVGVESEWQDFVQTVGPIRFAPTRNFLELARIIAAAKLFCGNQSAPLAIAMGLGIKSVVEICPGADNCRFVGNINAIDASFTPPPV